MNTKASIIDGKKIAEQILLDLHEQVKIMDPRPGLAAMLIGDDPASQLYVRNKKKACEKVGINFYDYFCGGATHPLDTEADIIKVIEFLNNDPQVDSIIVQLPIPKNFNREKIISAIDPNKDVDGLHPKNVALFTTGDHTITPPLVNAVLEALAATDQPLKDKQTVIVANSPVFAQPIYEALQRKQVRVTTSDPTKRDKIKNADILITVVGQPGLITHDLVKDGVTIIDIGTTQMEDGSIAGDVAPDVAEVADYFTPVPGGIGPLTVAMLLRGTYELAKKNGK